MSSKALDAIRGEAMALSLGERAELARDLMASLDGPPDPDAQREWDKEICRRINALNSGETSVLEPETVLERVSARLARM